MVVVGSETSKSLFRVFNEKEDVELNVQGNENRKYTEICLVKSFTNNIESLVVGTEKGQIKVFGLPPYLNYDLNFDTFNAHAHPSEVVRILASPDGRYVFSAGSDGTLFVYAVTEYANESTLMKQEVTVTAARED
jgi:WD40 repeat protein